MTALCTVTTKALAALCTVTTKAMTALCTVTTKAMTALHCEPPIAHSQCVVHGTARSNRKIAGY